MENAFKTIIKKLSESDIFVTRLFLSFSFFFFFSFSTPHTFVVRNSSKMAASQPQENPHGKLLKTLEVDGKEYKYYSIPDLNDPRIGFLFSFFFFFLSFFSRHTKTNQPAYSHFFFLFLFLFLKNGSLDHLPYCIRILLECAIRNCDEYRFTSKHVETILNWGETQGKEEIPFLPSRVILQDFTFVFLFCFLVESCLG